MKILVFDIGGTSIKYGIAENGVIRETLETPTHAHKGGGFILETVLSLAKSFSGYEAVGISTAGQVDSRTGSIIYANSNIPNYTGTRLAAVIEQELHVPVAVENDVNAAALGEAIYGAGRDFDSFLCLTYGTGVGGAIVENKRIYHGSSFSAGEFGAIVTHGEKKLSGGSVFDGCYEQYASTTALVKRAMELDPELCSGRIIFENINDVQVQNLINSWINEILLGLSTLVHIFNPACIILGGGIMVQPYITQRIQRLLPEMIMPSFSRLSVLPAQLGNSAGLLGACHLAEERLRN